MGKRAFTEKAVCRGIFSTTIDKVRGESGVSQGKHNSDAGIIIKPLCYLAGLWTSAFHLMFEFYLFLV